MSGNGKEFPEDWLPALTWPQYYYPQQRSFTMSGKFQVWFVGGNGTGKTRILWGGLNLQALGIHPAQLAPPPLRIKVLVPSFEYVEEEVMPKLLDSSYVAQIDGEIGPMLPPSMLEKSFNARGFRGFKYKNGSIIRIATSEQGWKLMRGAEFDILGLDEEPDYRVFDENLRGLRNAKGGGRVYAGMTPPYEEGQGPTWTKEMIIDRAEVGDPDLDVFRAAMIDNPAIDAKFIEEFTRGKSPKQIAVQVYGEYPTWGDLVYGNYEDTIWDAGKKTGNLLPADLEIPENWEVNWVMAFDWHQSKPCAAVWGWIDADDNVIFFDELDPFVAEDKTIQQLTELFFQIEGHPHTKRKFRRWQDPKAKDKSNAVVRGFNAWDEFRNYGIITAEGRNRNPEVGISIVKEYMDGNQTDHPRVFFRETMKRTRQALRNHFWKRTKESTKAVPDPKWSDFPICMRYVLQELGSKYKKKRNKMPLTSIQNIDKERFRRLRLGAHV